MMAIKDIFKSIEFITGYDELLEILLEAYKRASIGKGHKRHSQGEPFINQWILRGSRMFGAGSLNYQIGKKNEEITRMENPEDKIGELLDIIVYAAAEIILIKEKMKKYEA